jgi:hypothetical protein
MSRAGKHLVYHREQLLFSPIPALEFPLPRVTRNRVHVISAAAVMHITQRQNELVPPTASTAQHMMYLFRHVVAFPVYKAGNAAQSLHGFHVGALSLGH